MYRKRRQTRMYCVTTFFNHLHRERDERCRGAEASSFGITVGGTVISNLRYADDTALIENSKEALEHLTKNVNEVGKQLNLKRNVKKTKLMVTGSLKEVHNITIDGEKSGAS